MVVYGMKFLLPLFFSLPVFAAEPEVLLVSPPELKSGWDEYVAMRAEQGTPMKLITTEQIAEDFEGPDIQEKIRLCVREHIDKHGYHTVILGGDSSGAGGLIPDRDTYHHNLWGMEKDVPSDVYYISPTNWDYDGDGIYGEFEDDSEAIAYPDGSVAVGRIPVRTLEDIKAYAGKVSKHLDAEPIEQLGMTCAVRSAYAKVFRSGNKLIPEAWPNGAVSFFFSDITSWDDADNRGAYDLNVANLGEKFSTGEINKWHLHGHGLIDRWILEGDEAFDHDAVNSLKNKQPLVITTVSCFTGQFDAEQDPSITETMLRQPDGGAVLVVAPSRIGKPHFHNPRQDMRLMAYEGKLDGTTQTMTSFWLESLGAEKKNAGMALAGAKASLADDSEQSAVYHQGMCELNLLGDPTLPVR